MKGNVRRHRIVIGLLGLVAVSSFVGAGNALAASKAPYADPNAVGSIGFCDQQGQQLTHGNVDTRPFVWKAVDQTAAPAGYNGSGATATMYAYQPRQGVDPPDWSGSQLNIASKFSNPAHPAVAMTGLDPALSIFVAGYPPQWDGFVQIRIYLNAPNEPTDNATYDAANIKVDGNTWTVVGGDSVPCTAGGADSLREVLATNTAAVASLTAQSTEKAPGAAAGVANVGGGKTPSGKASPGSTSTAQPSGSGGVVPQPSGSPAVSASALPASGSPLAATGASGGSSDTLVWILVIVGVLGAGVIGVQWVRSRT
jgi:hypothetical protein